MAQERQRGNRARPPARTALDRGNCAHGLSGRSSARQAVSVVIFRAHRARAASLDEARARPAPLLRHVRRWDDADARSDMRLWQRAACSRIPRRGERLRNRAKRGLRSISAQSVERFQKPAGVNEMKLVIIESPYAGDIEANVAYARKCMHDALMR